MQNRFALLKMSSRWLTIAVALLVSSTAYNLPLWAQQALKADSLGDPLPAGALLRLGTVRFRPPTNVSQLALSPDEKSVVSLGQQLIVWDTANGKERWRGDFNDHRNGVPGSAYGLRWLAFAPDGTRFYTPGDYGKFIAWDMATGKSESITIKDELSFELPSQVPNLPGQVRLGGKAIDVSPDGKTIVLGAAGGLKICDDKGKLLYEIENSVPRAEERIFSGNDRLLFGGHYSIGQFSPDGKILAAVMSAAPEEFQLLDAASGRQSRTIKATARIVRFAFSPNGKQLATTERDNAIRLYDLETGKQLWSYVAPLNAPTENYTSAVAFSPDGKLVAAGATDRRIYLIDAATGKLDTPLVGHIHYPWALGFTADNRMLYSSGWDGAIRRWDVPGRKQLPLPAGIRATEVVAASPDGRTVAYADDSGTVRLVSAADGKEIRALPRDGARVSALMFSPDAQQLAVGGRDGNALYAVVWNVASGEKFKRWDWPKGNSPFTEIEAFSFTPDGKRLAAAVFRQSAAFLWDLTTKEQIARLPHNEIYGLSFAVDGKTLATAGWDSFVRLWDANTGKSIKEVNVKSAVAPTAAQEKTAERYSTDSDLRIYAVSHAPFGGFAATAHMNNRVWIWNTDDMFPLRSINVIASFSYGAMCFSPDGLWLATGNASGGVTLWDPVSGQKVLDVGRHQDNVYTLSFGRDSRTLVSGSDEGIAYVWVLRPRESLPQQHADSLWSDLSSNNGAAAYQAIWLLADMRDDAVKVVSEKLKPGYFEMGTDARNQNWLTAQRAVSILAQIGTPSAEQLLKQLAAQEQNKELARLAAAALNRMPLRD